MQAHGSDAMVDEENCVFFLPHRPRSEICELPFFLFMKGTGTGTVILQFSVKLSIFFERCFFEFLAAFYISVQLHFYCYEQGGLVPELITMSH